MNYEVLIAFLIGMIILSATPGVGVFSSIAQAISGGFISSLFFISGLVLGDILFFILAVVGVTTISEIMGEMFFIIKIIGGIYLVYLGVKAIKKNKSVAKTIIKPKVTKSKTFTSGLLVTLGNPKPILFYASIVPTIVNLENIKMIEVITLILLIAVVSYFIIGGYCYLASATKRIFKRKSFERKLNELSGLTMLITGCYIILKKG
jgi:threonine/homoserine/homoserine lactone efflux protein